MKKNSICLQCVLWAGILHFGSAIVRKTIPLILFMKKKTSFSKSFQNTNLCSWKFPTRKNDKWITAFVPACVSDFYPGILPEYFCCRVDLLRCYVLIGHEVLESKEEVKTYRHADRTKSAISDRNSSSRLTTSFNWVNWVLKNSANLRENKWDTGHVPLFANFFSKIFLANYRCLPTFGKQRFSAGFFCQYWPFGWTTGGKVFLPLRTPEIWPWLN